MDDLRILRDKWAEIEAEETRLLRSMTVAHSLSEARMLYAAYATQSVEDSVEFSEHAAAIIAPQSRLARLAEWLQTHPEEFRQSAA